MRAGNRAIFRSYDGGDRLTFSKVQAQHQSGEGPQEIFAAEPAPSVDDIAAARARLRAAVEHDLPLERVAAGLAEGLGRVCFDSGVLHAVAERLGWSYDSLHVSIAAAFGPLADKGALERFARSLRPRRGIIGFVMAGNVPGAGLHEVIAGLLSGCALMAKTATAEPIFFTALAATLRNIDPQLGERIAVFNWPRERDDLTAEVRASCDIFVAFGDDGTVARLRSSIESSGRESFAGFGARVSGIVLAEEALDKATLYDAAMDVVRFEQRGCLSPHHIFVEDCGNGSALHAAVQLAEELRRISRTIRPARRLSLEDAAAIRRARELARWRSIGGHDVQLWEGADLDWTVIYDRAATFTVSPGYRTVSVSPFADSSDLEHRLDPVRGRIEAFAAAKSHRDRIEPLLRDCGATYICEPGRMQSPPLNWPHGGGAFLRLLRDDK